MRRDLRCGLRWGLVTDYAAYLVEIGKVRGMDHNKESVLLELCANTHLVDLGFPASRGGAIEELLPLRLTVMNFFF